MKRILFLFLPFLPYLASAQVAKDTVTVLTIADIPAGAIRDTTNFTFVQDNNFVKATFDSLYKYTRVKLLSLGAITSAELANALSDETGTGAAVFATNPTITLGAATGLPLSTGVTGQLPVGNGGTGQSTLTANKVLVGNGTSAVTSPSQLNWSATGNAGGTLTIGSPTSYVNNHKLHVQQTNAFSALFLDAVATASFTQFDFGRNNVAQVLVAVDHRTTPTDTRGLYFGVQTGTSGIGYRNIRFDSDGASATAELVLDSNLVGVGTNAPIYKLDVNGDVRADTYYYDVGSALVSSSDANFKKNILPLPPMLQKINALQPVEFEWNDLKLDQMQGRENLHKMLGKNIGLIAQDVYSVFPEFTGEDAEGNMTVSYISLIVPMLKAIQEQQAQIEQLKQRITQLENK